MFVWILEGEMLAAMKVLPNHEDSRPVSSTSFPRLRSDGLWTPPPESYLGDDADIVRKTRFLRFLKKELEGSRTDTEREVILSVLLLTWMQIEACDPKRIGGRVEFCRGEDPAFAMP